MNNNYAHHAVVLNETEKDGVLRRFNLVYLDVRFSNVCNFKCRYCNEMRSSAWYRDHMLCGGAPGRPVVLKPTAAPEGLWDQIEPLMSGVERIYFSGGEPLISREVQRTLTYLVREKAFHVGLLFSTNFSQMRAGGLDFMEIWSKFDYVSVAASLDATGTRGEYIRKNQRWLQVIENRKRMMRICPKTKFFIAPTLSVMNAIHLPDFHWEWVMQRLIEPDDIYINILFEPEMFSAQILPIELKREVCDQYEAYIEKIVRTFGDGKAAEQFRGALNFIRAGDASHQLSVFRETTRRLDQIRGESFEDIFPELKSLMKDSASAPGGLDGKEPSQVARALLDKALLTETVSLNNGKETQILPPPVAVGNKTQWNRETDSDLFCILPWTHMYLRSDGSVLPCRGAKSEPVGSTRKSSLNEIWNSDGLRKMRRDMLAGKACAQCAGCEQSEKNQMESLRQQSNRQTVLSRSGVKATRSDGWVDPQFLNYLEIQLSNVCNLKCRYCGHQQSTAWYRDYRRFGGSASEAVIIVPTHRPEDLVDQLRDVLPGLRWLRFDGGEPMISRAHYEILRLLEKTGRFDVRLSYLTNFSVTRYRDMDILKTWNLFHEVDVDAGLDASGGRGEYLRKNLNWERVVENRERMFIECPSVNFGVSVVLNVMNALHLPDFHREWTEKKYISPEDFRINLVAHRPEYSIQVLPESLKQQVAGKYEQHLNYLNSNYGRRVHPVAQSFRDAVAFMKAKDESHLLSEFRKKTTELDRSRGESFEKVFPEMAELMKVSLSEMKGSRG